MKRPSSYPWDSWLGKGRSVIKHGVDYEIGTGSMMNQIRRKAYVRGLSVSLVEGDGTITILVRARNVPSSPRRK